MRITLDNDGITCACYPGHTCRRCRCRKDLTIRLVINAWRDDVPADHHSRADLTHQQQVDRRDRAWTSRDAYCIFRDTREKYATTWWQERWPDYWSRQADVRDVLPDPSEANHAGWRAWMLEHQPECLPLTTDSDPGELDLFASVGLEMETS